MLARATPSLKLNLTNQIEVYKYNPIHIEITTNIGSVSNSHDTNRLFLSKNHYRSTNKNPSSSMSSRTESITLTSSRKKVVFCLVRVGQKIRSTGCKNVEEYFVV